MVALHRRLPHLPPGLQFTSFQAVREKQKELAFFSEILSLFPFLLGVAEAFLSRILNYHQLKISLILSLFLSLPHLPSFSRLLLSIHSPKAVSKEKLFLLPFSRSDQQDLQAE